MREPDVALVVVEEELHPLGVVERALGRPGTALMRSSVVAASSTRAACSGDPGSSFVSAVCSAPPAMLVVGSPSVALHERVGELDDRERRDDAVHRARSSSNVVVELLELGAALRR